MGTGAGRMSWSVTIPFRMTLGLRRTGRRLDTSFVDTFVVAKLSGVL